ncbi:hypothetical protein [Chelativorans sp. AA-79]|uniref:hypothetical protein n=1 Tax=Chelativorans sp. AA-79 TaxID=3028735 RepID=UPI0023F9E6EB|nr:hypothetical protein [Chelativorans sp. AA-79]WEX08333.1 hypothetical protein PVE73_19970 [Chelativorans sp. AA-79]
MAISPPGDILLEVARAASPEKVQAAQVRLRAIAGAGNGAFDHHTAVEASAHAGQRLPAAADQPDAFVKFEAMVLESFFQTMLPKDAGTAYGEGLSGEMWRGLLAGQLGEVFARRGGIGIAGRVLGDHYLEDGTKIPVAGVSFGRQAAEAAEQAALSTALVEEIERQAAKPLAGGAPSPENGE